MDQVYALVYAEGQPEEAEACATAEAEAVLLGLVDYAREHFRDEEDLLRRHFYPRLEEHLRQHEALLRQLREKVRLFQRADLSTVKLALFLGGWINGHILKQDLRFAAYLKARGLH